MRAVYFKALPYKKEEVTLALESGVDGLIVPDDMAEAARTLARGIVVPQSAVTFIRLGCKEDEQLAASLAKRAGKDAAPLLVVLCAGWEIIPLENLLALEQGNIEGGSARNTGIAVEARTREEALLACGVLERGVDTVVLTPEAVPDMKAIIEAVKHRPEPVQLASAVLTRIAPAGMGHRVCVDTTSLLRPGQGMLVGNSAAFTFLVNAETEPNEYVAARPFRVNAGAVHAYALMPEDRTAYLDELSAGSDVLIVSHRGETSRATVGRVKVERRPLLLLEAEAPGQDGEAPVRGAVFLQNAETIRLVRPDGTPVSVVELAEGDRILCRVDAAGRHFGMRIQEEIKEG